VTNGEVAIEIGGKTYTGRYDVKGNIITVTYLFGKRKTTLDQTPAPVLARMLLGELVRKSLRENKEA
jgi:hypothetical protein